MIGTDSRSPSITVEMTTRSSIEVRNRDRASTNFSLSSSRSAHNPVTRSIVGRLQIGGGTLQADEIRDLLETGDGMSVGEATSNLVIALVGVAVTTFPAAISGVGFVAGPLLLIFSAAMISECGLLICQTCDIAERDAGQKPGSLRSYEALASAVLGPMGQKVLLVTKNAVFLSSVALFATFLTDSFYTFVPGRPYPLATKRDIMLGLRFGVTLPLLIGLAMLKDMKQLARFASLGLLGMFMQIGGILLGCALNIFSADACEGADLLDKTVNCREYLPYPEITPKMWASRLGTVSSVFVFAFAVVATLPSVRSQLADPAKMPDVVRNSFGISLFVYLVVLLMGYLAFGQRSEPNIILNVAEHYPMLGNVPVVGLILNISFSIPIFVLCVVSVFEASGSKSIHTPLTPVNMLLRACVMVMLTLVSWKLPYITESIGVVSSVFCVINNMFVPLLAFSIASKSGAKPGFLMNVLHIVVLLFGLLVLYFGFTGSLHSMLDRIREDSAQPT